MTSEQDGEEGGVSWSVYDLAPDLSSLDPDARDRLSLWVQGDVVDGLSPAWVGTPELDPVTGTDPGIKMSEPGTESVTISGSGVFIPWVVVSQTCDIGLDGPGAHHPFVQVAPLVRVSDLPSKPLQKLALADRVNYLFATDYESDDDRPVWLADLRMMMPLSKGILLNLEPRRGFKSEERALLFGEQVGGKLRRPALDSALTEDLADLMNKHVKTRGAGHSTFTRTEQVRIIVEEGTRLSPQRVAAIVLTRVNLTEDQEQEWRDWETAGRALLKQHNIVLSPTLFQTPYECSAHLYRSSIPLRLDALKAAATW